MNQIVDFYKLVSQYFGFWHFLFLPWKYETLWYIENQKRG